ncbi:hypothetical protein E4L95_13940 [Paracoccus liaowanqingii]|uniref:Uncharacterized protein n=1 Tax=Paracoccus liaowanqingii TaxID=2560053 RepID=A0A4Z1CF96_9RHOB|nr:hypothetical protein [Paracoccus liaowanqingii]TGN56702.1 hypothetical protein E4L95_13940 [Paracoccus liaowanqingii]
MFIEIAEYGYDRKITLNVSLIRSITVLPARGNTELAHIRMNDDPKELVVNETYAALINQIRQTGRSSSA